MMRTTGFSAPWAAPLRVLPLLLTAALAAGAVPARAAEEDVQGWLVMTGTVPLGPQTSATLELTPRFREQGDQLQSRASFDLALSDRASIGGGATYVEFAGGRELRPHQQVVLRAGPLSFRTRLEQRFLEGAPRAQLRLRHRAAANLPLGERTMLTGSGEFFHILRPERAGQAARVEQWRASLAVQRRLSERIAVGLGYLLILAPRSGAADRISHVPQASLVFRR